MKHHLDTDVLVIRPSLRTFLNRLVAACFVVAIVMALYLWRQWRDPFGREVYAVAFTLLIVAFMLALLLVFRREEIKVAEGTLTRKNWLGIPRQYRLDGVGGMARRDMTVAFGPRPFQYVVVYDIGHRCLFKMSRPIWDPIDIKRLHAKLGGDSKVKLLSASELAEEFPGSVAWTLMHPMVSCVLQTVVMLTLFFGAIIVVEALRHR